MARPTTYCPKCAKNVSNNNIKKHSAACDGPKVKKIRGIDFDPNIGFALGTRVAWNKGLTIASDSRVADNATAVKLSKADSPPTGCCAWSSEQRSANAKKHGFGGYRENAGRSKKFSVLDSLGKQTTLQSTFELRCSEILNELGIRWVRPKALKYDGRNYFADFYLIDCDVWLDPKNNFKAKQDEEKIRKVIEQNDVKLYVLLEHQLTKEYITRII